MHCSNCDFDNPAGMKFCGQCGTQLQNRCGQCGFENPPGFQFCGQCGTSLTGRTKGKRQKLKGKNNLSKPQHPAPNTQPPVSYTPKYLAERILAEREAMEA